MKGINHLMLFVLMVGTGCGLEHLPDIFNSGDRFSAMGFPTVEETLVNLEKAWAEGDCELYAVCLHPDIFSFIFAEYDREIYGLPDS